MASSSQPRSASSMPRELCSSERAMVSFSRAMKSQNPTVECGVNGGRTLEIQLDTEQPGAKLGHTGPLLVTVYSGARSLEGLDALDQLQGKLLGQYPKIATVAVIDSAPLSGIPKGLTEKSGELRKKYDDKLAGSAIIVRATGLGGVVTRTFLAAFSLTSFG